MVLSKNYMNQGDGRFTSQGLSPHGVNPFNAKAIFCAVIKPRTTIVHYKNQSVSEASFADSTCASCQPT
jgi:hypothetical protein